MKKVLASVLAGSMVLGMASMASAASLVKADKTKNYDFYMTDVHGTVAIPAAVWSAYEDYKEAYDAVDKAEDKTNVPKADVEAILTKYQTLYQKASQAKNVKVFTNEYKAVKDIVASQFVADFEAKNPTIGVCTATVSSIAGTAKFGAALALNVGLKTPSQVLDDLNAVFGEDVANGKYGIENKAEFELKDGDEWYNLYNFGDDDTKEITIQIPVQKDTSVRVDVASGDVTITRKKDHTNKDLGLDYYNITIKAAAGVHDLELDDFKIEVELKDPNIVFFIKGKVAYSDWQYVEPGEVMRADKKSNYAGDHDKGCAFNFDEVIDEKTRIICNDYVDLIFEGNYGTDYENLRVVDDNIQEVEDFFQDYDIDYYDFVGTPKFAKDVTIRVDADSDSYIYEFDKKTGDVVDITDECTYTSDGWTFKRKSFKTYVVLEEPYEGGNVRADKEPVDDEPTEPDDTDATGSKPNPGTGAMPF